MKQLLFLLLFPCLALAQYQGNANQKITLGEQTTADGLVWRGITSDTVNLLTNKLDTSVYIVLDTGTRAMWYYRASTTPKWTRLVDSLNNLQGQLSLTSKVTGTLPVANGGTGQSTLAAAGINTGSGTLNYLPKYTATGTTLGNSIIFDNGSNVGIGTASLTEKLHVDGNGLFTSSVTATKFIPTGTSASGNGIYLPVSNNISISTAGNENLRLTEKGNLGLGVDPDPMTSNNYKSIVLQGVTGGEILLNNSTTNVGYIYANINGAVLDGKGTFRFQTNAVDRLIVYSGGNVGIGTQIPSTNDTATAKLHVVGNARITAVGTANASNSALYITNTGVLSTNASDVNKKHNIRNLPYGLNTINNLNPVAFEWNETDETDIGFIAQDIENVIPESVITNWDSELIFRQEKIIPVLVKAIQEQQALIKALEQRILILENK